MDSINEESFELFLNELINESQADCSCDKLNIDDFTDDDFEIVDQMFNPNKKIDYIDTALEFLYKITTNYIPATDTDALKNATSEMQKLETEMREVAKNISSKSIKFVPRLTEILKKYNSKLEENK